MVNEVAGMFKEVIKLDKEGYFMQGEQHCYPIC